MRYLLRGVRCGGFFLSAHECVVLGGVLLGVMFSGVVQMSGKSSESEMGLGCPVKSSESGA